MDRIELLSPAGDFERLKITLLYGADAVYIGGQEFGLRANATNFSLSEIKEACTFAHALQKKVYLTVNMIFHEEDFAHITSYLQDVVEAGIDAFIVSDIWLVSYLHTHYPKVEIHISTQSSSMNIETVQFYQKLGAKRVVLAREVSLKDIRKMTSLGVDIECFIHGAMCTFVSGRCVLSNDITNRDSNRGGCSQVCRFAFDNETSSKFTMATKDLNMSHHIKALIEAGVKSLKVEGRMRSPYYLATVIGTYRKLIDAVYNHTLDDTLIQYADRVLSRVANRETSTHYYFHEADWTDQYYTGRQELSNQDYLGYVVGYEDGYMMVSERNYFTPETEVEVFMPSGKVVSFVIHEIYDEEMHLLDAARHPEQILKIKVDEEIEIHSMMRIKPKEGNHE